MKVFQYLVVVFFVIIIFSCTTDEECRKDRYVQLNAKFYTNILNTSTNKYTTSSLTIDSITLKGVDVDSILYKNSKKISSVFLPLNKFKSESKFSVKFNQITDTITILNSNIEQYLSLECGCIKVHTIDTVLTTNHYIDSVKIKVRNVNTIQSEHVQIYN